MISSTTTLEDAIARHASANPQSIAVESHGVCLTYGELWQAVMDRAASWSGVCSTPLVLRVSQDVDFVVSYLAAHLARRVIVPLEHDVPQERFDQVCSIVNESAIPPEVADILFTTGTTGQSKGTMISHRAIRANAENLAEAQKFSQDLCFVICGPMNHIGSLSKLWPTFLVGGAVRILEGMKDINAFFDAVAAHTKVGTFLVPANIRILLQFSAHRIADLSHSFDLIETGAAPMSAADMEHISQLLPHTRLYNTYASTETGIICTYDYNHEPCIAGCLGRPMKHSTVTISAEGTVVCHGDTLMTGYVGAEELTRTVLYDNAVHTADLAYLDERGCLRLTGREDDVINLAGFKVAPVEVEDFALAYPNIKDCICIATAHPILGTALRLLVVLSDAEKPFDKRALAQHLKQHLESYKVPTSYEVVSAVRRTYNGKLDRKSYRK